MFFELTQIFQEGLSNRLQDGSICSSNRPYYLHRTDNNFPGASIFSLNRYSFFKKPYLVLKHIIFQETPMPQTGRHFTGRYAPPLPVGFFNLELHHSGQKGGLWHWQNGVWFQESWITQC